MLSLVLCQVGDYLSTEHALQNPKAREANPIIRWIGLVPVKILIGGFLCAAITYTFWHQKAYVSSSAVCLSLSCLYGWIIWHNYQIPVPPSTSTQD